MSNTLRHLSLKSKIIITSTVAVLAMSCALTLFSTHVLEKEIDTTISERINEVSVAATEGISNWMDAKYAVIDSIAKDINRVSDPKMLLKLGNRAGLFSDMYYGHPDGTIISSSYASYGVGYDPRVQPWYQDAVQKQGIIATKPYIGAGIGKYLVAIAKPVMQDGKLTGVLGASLNVGDKFSQITQMTVGKNSNVFLVSRAGNFVANKETRLLGQPINTVYQQVSQSDISRYAETKTLHLIEVDGIPKIISFHKVKGTDWYFGVVIDYQAEKARFHEMLEQQALIVVVLSLLVIFCTGLMMNYLFKDLYKVSKALENIAVGEGDLTVRIDTQSKDEIGQLAHNFNRFVASMQHIVTNLRTVAEGVTEQASLAAEKAEENLKQANHQLDEINMIAAASEEMNCTTLDIASNAEQTADGVNTTIELSEDGLQQVSKSQQSITHLADEVSEVCTVIEQLNHHAGKINGIIGSIQDIAEQTNLLSLNATIEAARSGDAGKGFSVVANEVRILSLRTREATEEIHSMVSTLLGVIDNTVKVMERSGKTAVSSVEEANKACDSFKQIAEAIHNIGDMATQIASATEQQSAVTREVSVNADTIRNVAEQFSVEANAGTERAASLNQLSLELQQEIGKFKI
ncbi:methyl-accepting chemotaxis protein [Shewanella sp. NFH-SH190041]|uniref:methyl-accepting chemotaxis protein n=1 Tax=Shewanella sp. NFH-SH190041 TaxID=2950245 RepID=UPI0021C4C3B6|nr:methyl-accepting chemotaxis protein [Shewanella sp. NFH-SH190041]BDM64405.1 methyl-accepting chemotaxis protein [Shewanella sp. NFH-SH190041]